MENEFDYKKDKILIIIMYFCLSLSLISSITNMIISILNNDINIGKIITVILVSIFSLILILLSLFYKDKKVRIPTTILSVIISIFSITSIIINLVSTDTMPNFVGKDIKDLISWADSRNIIVEQEFNYSDTIPKYKIIKQNISEGTKVKDIDKISVIVSDGIDENKETEITNMIGWKLDDVIKYIDDNHLTNVTILFEYNRNTKKDIIFEQDVIKEIKRNEPITLKSSLGIEGELKNVTMEKLVGLDLFHALVYLGRNDLNYEIEYVYSDKEENTVLKQSVKEWDVIERDSYSPIIIKVAKQNEITVSDLSKMKQSEIITWATNNRIKVDFTFEYSDTIKEGKVISYSPKKGNLISIDDTIYVTISKGTLHMIKFTNVEDFITWADEHEISYEIDYEFSNTISKGNLISSSHKENEVIKNNDTVNLVISQGGNTIIPNLIGMSKKEAEVACKEANIKCNFTSEETNTTVIKQSMRSGSNVPANTTVTLTLGN